MYNSSQHHHSSSSSSKPLINQNIHPCKTITLTFILTIIYTFSTSLTTASTLIPQSSSFSSLIHPPSTLCSQPKGPIEDANCAFETIDEVNRRLHSQLTQAVQLPIFRYHKVDLYRQCPFWSEDGACGNIACAVDELDQKDIPQYWRSKELSGLKTTDSNRLPPNLDQKPCHTQSNDQNFCVLDDHYLEPSSQSVYVDLLANPERFTGYSGTSASRIWQSIYEENCFDLIPKSTIPSTSSVSFGFPQSGIIDSSLISPKAIPASLNGRQSLERFGDQTCLEKRVYYKLLSGLHASISIHICDEYLDPISGKWIPNLQCYLQRVGSHPDRLENLYFTYTLMLRALSKSSNYLRSERVELCTDDEKADAQTKEVLEHLISTSQEYPGTFDEHSMFLVSEKKKGLKEEFKMHFRNVSRIMDCVGCDKCRLWGKLQVMGLGTGLKLLFEYEEGDQLQNDFHLTRPELISFINTLHRLSESLVAVAKFRKIWERRQLDGTLPNEMVNERFDSKVSGETASAMEIKAGLGPRIQESEEDKKGKEDGLVEMSLKASEETIEKNLTDDLISQSNLSEKTEERSDRLSDLISERFNEEAAKASTSSNRTSNQTLEGYFKHPSLMMIESNKFLKILTSRCKKTCEGWMGLTFDEFKRSLKRMSGNDNGISNNNSSSSNKSRNKTNEKIGIGMEKIRERKEF
ncbi:hypothetical protein DFH28DRAFT_986408 [Melampsora americana]|nr:hypothetical protein DFH28DRAFT_986408 [Melampsora americana]